MSGKADEIDIVMAIENIGNELKKMNNEIYNKHFGLVDVLNDIAGSLELLVLAFQGVYK